MLNRAESGLGNLHLEPVVGGGKVVLYASLLTTLPDAVEKTKHNVRKLVTNHSEIVFTTFMIRSILRLPEVKSILAFSNFWEG